MSDFSERLKIERKRLGLNQAELGSAGGVSKGAQLNYESGERSPTAEYLQAIGSIGVDVTFLLTGLRLAGAPLTSEQSELLSSFSNADQAGRAALLAVASIAARAPNKESGNKVSIGGDVGQSIAGDASFAAPVSFAVGKKKP